MNKKCGKCEKIVYATEEVKCLDKAWHKGCFRCWECGMALNMRTYKGFNKLPYCEAHIPKPKATTMAETPELARIAENSKIQSNAKYHADFEASKGRFTTVADDPETLRIRNNTKIISNVAYHGEIERKAEMEHMRQMSAEHDKSAGRTQSISTRPQTSNAAVVSDRHHVNAVTNNNRSAPMVRASSPPRTAPAATVASIDSLQHGRGSYMQNYDPVNENYSSRQQTYQQPSNDGYRHQPPSDQSVQQQRHQQLQQQQLQQQQLQQQRLQLQQQQLQQQQLQQQQLQQQHNSYRSEQRCFRAVYDYDAADYDEISFRDGDLIINCQSIDEGWMTGTCQRTGQRGMLPANYVEPTDM